MKGMMADMMKNNPEMMKENHAKMKHDEREPEMMKSMMQNDENDGG
jgi:hypothetical protein